jgi:catechol 2,3-dioxygenase-like lactoylglutathione lyase family enzyme
VSAPNLKLVPTRGIDHLAFVTDDLPATLDFYTRVVGLQLVHVRRVPFEQDRGQPPFDNLRHYFFNLGNDTLLAFFEYPKGLPRQCRDHPGGMQHVAFHVPPDRFDAAIQHIRTEGVDVIGPVALGGRFWSAYFYDPNGIRLEFATDRSGSSRSVLESVLQTEDEAREELATLFPNKADVDAWIAKMPIRQHSDEDDATPGEPRKLEDQPT